MTKRERLLGQGARISGLECLDFINTVNWHGSDDPNKWRDRFHEYADIVWWAHYGGILSKKDMRSFLAAAKKSPARAEQALETARAFREIFYRIILARISDRALPETDLLSFNSSVKEAVLYGELVRKSESFVWQWQYDYKVLIAPLYPVIYAAAQLLLSEQLPNIGLCANSGCGWLYLDTSKNKNRRWCTMKVCGSRAKAKDYYYRQQTKIRKEKMKNANS